MGAISLMFKFSPSNASSGSRLENLLWFQINKQGVAIRMSWHTFLGKKSVGDVYSRFKCIPRILPNKVVLQHQIFFKVNTFFIVYYGKTFILDKMYHISDKIKCLIILSR